MEKIVAIVRFEGDDSVGIFSETFEVPCPFYEKNKEDLDFFREALLNLYKEFGYGGCSVVYDFEQAAEDESAGRLVGTGLARREKIIKMKQGWENYEPAPIEFFHGRLLELFHQFRKTKTNDLKVEINGTELNDIIAAAKNDTFTKYPKQKK